MSKSENELRTALVVDDEAPIRGLLEDILDDAGFTTTSFALGGPALQELAKHSFDLLIIDIGLPDMNGLSICEEARARYGSDVVILIITADSRKERCIMALEMGADDFVGKPFDIEELLIRIDVKLRRTARSNGNTY